MYYDLSKETWEHQLESAKNVQYIYGEAIRVNAINAVGFTLSITDDFKGKTLLVTATLTVTEDYASSTTLRYDPSVQGGLVHENTPLSYSAGDVIDKQTQEIELGRSNTFSFTYAPSPKDITLGHCCTKLTVTVTDPKSGASYTTTYPWTLKLMRVSLGSFTYNVRGGLTEGFLAL